MKRWTGQEIISMNNQPSRYRIADGILAIKLSRTSIVFSSPGLRENKAFKKFRPTKPQLWKFLFVAKIFRAIFAKDFFPFLVFFVSENDIGENGIVRLNLPKI